MIEPWLESHHDELVAFRRHLHAHPEPSGKEQETTVFIAERLEVAGLETRVLTSGTGLLCDFGEGDGPIVALRADIDALEMDDEKTVHYRSQHPGVAHACGHDVHTTVVLGTGIYLAQLGAELGGRVRLIFQPAEERVPGGALDVIADAGLAEVGTVLGVHCDPKLDVGRIGLRSGPITAAADMAELVVTGPGGHTARPEETVDMVYLAARIVHELPHRVAAELGGDSGLFKLVFGSVQSGEAANVIPTHAVLRATVRTRSMDTWQALPAAFERAAAALVAEAGADAEVVYTHGVPPVDNDPDVTALVEQVASRELSPAAITGAIQSWGGDDFAWYLQRAPGTYIRLGTHDPDSPNDRFDLHVGHFDVDERAIAVGIRVLSAAALARLA
ncbi:MAG: amidohydrolase [Acidimicrobiia bacterium]|nr:amidohydrolase [Acidimicrobiia bacterium]